MLEATKLLEKWGRPESTPITRIVEGGETAVFKVPLIVQSKSFAGLDTNVNISMSHVFLKSCQLVAALLL